MTKYTELDIVCNGCGQLMRRMGEWPVQYPKAEAGPLSVPNGAMNVQRTSRYNCMTCRTPNDKYVKGVPVGIAIIEGTE